MSTLTISILITGFVLGVIAGELVSSFIVEPLVNRLEKR